MVAHVLHGMVYAGHVIFALACCSVCMWVVMLRWLVDSSLVQIHVWLLVGAVLVWLLVGVVWWLLVGAVLVVAGRCGFSGCW